MTRYIWTNPTSTPWMQVADHRQYDYEAICDAAGVDPEDEEYDLVETLEDSDVGPAGTILLLGLTVEGHPVWVLSPDEFRAAPAEQSYYLVSKEWTGPRPSSEADGIADWYELNRVRYTLQAYPPETVNGDVTRLEGSLGTVNDWHYEAHGVYADANAARAYIERVEGPARQIIERTPTDDGVIAVWDAQDATDWWSAADWLGASEDRVRDLISSLGVEGALEQLESEARDPATDEPIVVVGLRDYLESLAREA